ncbi:SMC family ATPase [Salibacterium salarium]|uniref:Nuclease SbcCD subunit C n=1 Tax=Salibacterium salarium TaxID=284579 RepID=A0A3R9QTX4_9BACI|nr:SMC family ATPase [Salibacterium salarium]RSL33380.1 SMC family ATPase [Salibacterium salarium]
MRPIELSIKGLHSFREKQTIDFSKLCQGGVFGIFGPTGSGKSSLLDAMTLALYGKVERAPNNTHGIINQAEDELFVSFSFELGQKGNASKYMVERTYKRSGENHVKSAVTRLHNLTGDPEVLADKTNEVNKQVEDMLGLSIDDFTRAVVLPQGKFSEFLKLRGNDRRQMLQRIFHLEKYGDGLIKKVKTNLQNTTHEKERIESEQQGLGEASKEAVETAEKQVKYWNEKVEEWTAKKAEVDKKVEQEKQLKTWLEEREEAIEHLRKLTGQQEDIEKHKEVLKQSNQAESLLPFAEAFLQSQQEKETWLKKEKNDSAALKEIASKEKDITSRYEQFKRDKQEIDQKLNQRKQTVDKAEEIEKEITTQAKEKSRLDRELEKINEKAGYYNKEEEKMQHNLDKYKQAVKDFQEQQASLNKNIKNKYAIFQAKQEKQSITHLQKQHEQRKQEENDERQKKIHIEEQKNNKEKEIKTQEDHAEKRFQQLMYWYNKCKQDKNWFEKNIYKLHQWSRAYAEQEEQKKHQEMAVHLAAQLQTGQACPVCGSIEHPAPHETDETNDSENLSNKRQYIDNWIDYLKTFDIEISQREWKLQQLSDWVTEIMQETVFSSSASEEIDISHNNITSDNDWEKMIHEQLQQWEVEKNTIENLYYRIEQEKHQYQQMMEEYKELSHQYETVNKAFAEKSEQRIQLEQEINEAINQWKQSYSELDFDTLEEEYKMIQENDEKKEKLQERIDQGSAHIQKLQSELEQWISERHTIMMEQTELNARTQQLSSYLDVKQKQLTSMLEGYSLSQLKREVQTEEADWVTIGERITAEVEQIQKQKQEAENEQAIAAHSLKEAEKRLEDAHNKWHDQLEKLENKDIEPSAVKHDVLTDEQQQRFDERIKQHEKAMNNWQNTKESLDNKIGNRFISEEEWRSLEEHRLDVNSRVDEAREKRGAAVETLQEMQKKQERYQALEKERKEWEKKNEQYKRLEYVFRGRGFVEFLAEEQLMQVSRTASERLHGLTRGRYAIEVDSQGGFIVRDDANGGLKRPVSSLSGGETFLTSLALALSLSASIQLKGEYPLEFFFLDEGFGTLDQDLLDTVMTSLEKLQTNNLAVGIISHVPEIQERLAKKLFVSPAQPSGAGSRVYYQLD